MTTAGALAGRVPLRTMLGDVDFRRLLRVRLAGQAGDGLFQGALFGAAFFNPEKATSAAAAASAFAAVLLPYSLVGPFIGTFIDRWSRQRVLAISNLVRAGLCAFVALSITQTGAVSPATIGLALVIVSLNRFVLSALSASLPHVVHDKGLITANAFTTTLGSAAAAIGGVSSLGLRRLWGSGDAGGGRTALAGGLVYLLTAVLASRLARRRLGPDTDVTPLALTHALATVARGLLAGARHVQERRPASRALAVITVQRFFQGVTFVATLLLYTRQGWIHRGFTGLGEVLTATVVGGLGAALVTPRATRVMGMQRWMLLVLSAAAVVELAFGLPYTHASLVAGGVLLGLCQQSAKICVDTIVQESVDDEFRGRVFSLYDMLSNVSYAAAGGLAAVVVPNDGRSYGVLVGVTIGYALTAVGYGLVLRRPGPGALRLA